MLLFLVLAAHTGTARELCKQENKGPFNIQSNVLGIFTY